MEQGFELHQIFGVAEPNWLNSSRPFPDIGANRSAMFLAMWSNGRMEAMMSMMYDGLYDS